MLPAGQVSVPTLVSCGRLCLHVRWRHIDSFLPDAHDLEQSEEQFAVRAWAFAELTALLLVIVCLSLEVTNAMRRSVSEPVNSSYRVLPLDDDTESVRKTPGNNQGGAFGDTNRTDSFEDGDILFAFFLAVYHWLCWALAGAAFVNDFVSKCIGLDYGFYFIWCVLICVMHVSCLIGSICWSCKPQRPAAISKSVLKSFFPILSQPLDALRDASLAAIYLSCGSIGILPFLLVLLGVVVPLVLILRDRQAFADIKTSYWPLLVEQEVDDEMAGIERQRTNETVERQRTNETIREERTNELVSAIPDTKYSERVLLTAMDQTSPRKQYFAVFGEGPQASAALLFWGLGGASWLSKVSGLLSVTRLAVVMAARPLVLNGMAAQRLAWSKVSALDVRRAVTWKTSPWKSRVSACSELFHREQSGHIVDAALEALSQLFSDSEGVEEHARREAEVDTIGALLPLLTGGLSEDKAEKCMKSIDPSISFCELAQFSVIACKDLRSETAAVRLTGVRELMKMPGTYDVYFSDHVVKLLKDPDNDVRSVAAEALGKFRPEAAGRVASQVAELLKDPDRDVRSNAATLLGGFGPEAAGCFAPQVADLLKDSMDCRRAAAQALPKLGPEAAGQVAPQVAKLLTHSDIEIRNTAATVLGGFGPATAGSFAAQVAELLQDSDRNVRLTAVRALGMFGAEAGGNFVPQIAELLKDSDRVVRNASAEVLGGFGPDAAGDFADQLAELLQDADEIVRRTASRCSLCTQVGGEAVVDLPAAKVPAAQVPAAEAPAAEAPAAEAPTAEMPTAEMPTAEMPAEGVETPADRRVD